jgi:hypothetical protein
MCHEHGFHMHDSDADAYTVNVVLTIMLTLLRTCYMTLTGAH